MHNWPAPWPRCWTPQRLTRLLERHVGATQASYCNHERERPRLLLRTPKGHDRHQRPMDLQLWFTQDRKTIGYVLFDLTASASALWGMSVSPCRRRTGLAAIFVALWLQLCARLGVRPSTRRIDKPLLSLVLQRFGFEPLGTGIALKVAPPVSENGVSAPTVIWAEDMERLRSVFSWRYLRSQNLEIAAEQPSGSTTVHVNTAYSAPIAQEWQMHMTKHIACKAHFHWPVPGGPLKGPRDLFDLLAGVSPSLPARYLQHLALNAVLVV
eukprot:GGOE01044922.1.p1 GENE.GGOE01044922.1~~GGOE01044922.1.p1  ORF type:complete len:268 (-),score=16.24 GGOE01044922.1:5-808(-)